MKGQIFDIQKFALQEEPGKGIEVLSYHDFGASKYKKIGKEYLPYTKNFNKNKRNFISYTSMCMWE